MSRGGNMAAFKRGLDEAFVKALNKEYEKGEDGWWSQFVDDDDLFLAIRDNAVDVYYRGCTLIHLEWRPRKKEIVSRTHYKYLLRPKMKPEHVDVGDGQPSIPNASAYFADQLSVQDLKDAAKPHVRDEKEGVHEILLKNHYVLDVEVAISDGEGGQIDFAALQDGIEEGQTHVVFYEVKHFGNTKELRSRGKPKVLEQIDRYRSLLKREQNRADIAKSYCRVSENLCALNGVPKRYCKRHDLLQGTKYFIVEEEPGLVVFGFDEDQKSGAIWEPHKEKLECVLKDRLLLKGDPKDVKIPTTIKDATP